MPGEGQKVADDRRREHLLRVLAAATFVIFFQAYMVAPLIPRLSAAFGVSEQSIGLMVPAYMIPYGVATLLYGILSDRIGRRRIMLGSLLAFVLLALLTATARSSWQLIFWRLLTGLGAGGVVPLALALMGRLYPYESRGRPLGWLFGAMAGGMALGATVGVILEPFVGWRALFFGVAAVGAIVVAALRPFTVLLGEPPPEPPPVRAVLAGYRELLASARGRRTYGYVLVNGLFHSGVFTWLGVYFSRRYGLGEVGIGLALLGYGIPGFVLGPFIGRLADRLGRGRLIPIGAAIGAGAAGVLILDLPLGITTVVVVLLSLGYDMTQPLLGGIVTALGGEKRPGQAMGLNVFILFTSFGAGSYLFGEALRWGFGPALAMFAGVMALAAIAAVPLFRSERPASKERAEIEG